MKILPIAMEGALHTVLLRTPVTIVCLRLGVEKVACS